MVNYAVKESTQTIKGKRTYVCDVTVTGVTNLTLTITSHSTVGKIRARNEVLATLGSVIGLVTTAKKDLDAKW